jgi:hypothetical protein
LCCWHKKHRSEESPLWNLTSDQLPWEENNQQTCTMVDLLATTWAVTAISCWTVIAIQMLMIYHSNNKYIFAMDHGFWMGGIMEPEYSHEHW